MTTLKRIVNSAPPPCGLKDVIRDENGSALIIALIILVVLTLMGVVATQTSTTEIKIAANDKQHKITFYEADGATEFATELLEQNIEELGFDESTIGTGDIAIAVPEPNFYINESDLATTASDTNRDFYFPAGHTATDPRTNFTVGGEARFSDGSAIEMAAAYEGRGKSAGQGGTTIIYDVITQRVGVQNSEAIVRMQWRHVN